MSSTFLKQKQIYKLVPSFLALNFAFQACAPAQTTAAQISFQIVPAKNSSQKLAQSSQSKLVQDATGNTAPIAKNYCYFLNIFSSGVSSLDVWTAPAGSGNFPGIGQIQGLYAYGATATAQLASGVTAQFDLVGFPSSALNGNCTGVVKVLAPSSSSGNSGPSMTINGQAFDTEVFLVASGTATISGDTLVTLVATSTDGNGVQYGPGGNSNTTQQLSLTSGSNDMSFLDGTTQMAYYSVQNTGSTPVTFTSVSTPNPPFFFAGNGFPGMTATQDTSGQLCSLNAKLQPGTSCIFYITFSSTTGDSGNYGSVVQLQYSNGTLNGGLAFNLTASTTSQTSNNSGNNGPSLEVVVNATSTPGQVQASIIDTYQGLVQTSVSGALQANFFSDNQCLVPINAASFSANSSSGTATFPVPQGSPATFWVVVKGSAISGNQDNQSYTVAAPGFCTAINLSAPAPTAPALIFTEVPTATIFADSPFGASVTVSGYSPVEAEDQIHFYLRDMSSSMNSSIPVNSSPIYFTSGTVSGSNLNLTVANLSVSPMNVTLGKTYTLFSQFGTNTNSQANLVQGPSVTVQSYCDGSAYVALLSQTTTPYKLCPQDVTSMSAFMTTNYSSSFVLEKNIDFLGSGVTWAPVGTATNPFSGDFSGNNFSMSHVSISGAGSGVGFFGVAKGTIEYLKLNLSQVITTSGTGVPGEGGLVGEYQGTALGSNTANIHDVAVTLSGSIVSPGFYGIGGVFGVITSNPLIQNVTFTGTSSSSRVSGSTSQIGGFLGYLGGSASPTFENCSVGGTLTITGLQQVGGFAGQANSTLPGTTFQYDSVGNGVTVSDIVASGEASFGGFIGEFGAGNILNSSVENATVNLTGSNPTNVGGFIGLIDSSGSSPVNVTQSYTSAKVTATSGSNVGGFVGTLSPTSNIPAIDQSFVNTSLVSGYSSVGGFVGKVSFASIIPSIQESYAIVNTVTGLATTAANVGGFIGVLSGSSAITFNSIFVNVSSLATSDTALAGIIVGNNTAPSVTASPINYITLAGFGTTGSGSAQSIPGNLIGVPPANISNPASYTLDNQFMYVASAGLASPGPHLTWENLVQWQSPSGAPTSPLVPTANQYVASSDWSGSNMSLSSDGSGGDFKVLANRAVSSGITYWEILVTSGNPIVGVAAQTATTSNWIAPGRDDLTSPSYGLQNYGGGAEVVGSGMSDSIPVSTTPSTYPQSVIGVYLNLNTASPYVSFTVNGSWISDPETMNTLEVPVVAGFSYAPMVGVQGNDSGSNYGTAQAFSVTAFFHSSPINIAPLSQTAFTIPWASTFPVNPAIDFGFIQ